MSIQTRRDLVVLVPDKNMEAMVTGLLSKAESFQIRHVDYVIFTHPGRDPGCLRESHNFLRQFAKQFTYAMVILDHEGCGREDKQPEVLANEVQKRLSASGWEQRCVAILIVPELEAWVWNDSPNVERIFGWQAREIKLRDWLVNNGFWDPELSRPHRPKEAMEAALRQVRKVRSSSIYLNLAREVSFEHCDDPSFHKFKATLQAWFSEGS